MSENNKKKIYKPQPISGFPEWLPEVRMVEQQWFDHIRRVFESYGFCSIETPAVEALDAINAKGGDGESDADKEIYVLERLHKEEGDREARLALHFDQTVPLARYTAQHFNDLTFPFKRYQMQKVWRGERPQAGRFREFYQCDIDVINVDNLPLHFDAEMPAVMWEILSSLPGMESEKIQIRVSNRKILMGLLEGLGINNKTQVIRIVDKFEKWGICEIDKMLTNEAHLTSEQAGYILQILTEFNYENFVGINAFFGNLQEFAQIYTGDHLVEGLANNENALNKMKEGISELAFLLDNLSHLPPGAVVADLSIVRGLDYYTGTVYETVFTDDPTYGSICSGGRYDDLAGSYINKSLPGVGISLGFSRLFERLRAQGKFDLSRKSPADILMVLPSDEKREEAYNTAAILRQRYNVEMYHAPQKLKKQLAYAEKKGIPYVWFPPFEDGQSHEVKDMKTGDQRPATPEDWTK